MKYTFLLSMDKHVLAAGIPRGAVCPQFVIASPVSRYSDLNP
jgi:hypothetical protein